MSQGGSDMPPTHFAITTVNVPDRLDLRDMDDRNQAEEDTRRRGFDGAAFRAWAPRLFAIGILALIAFAIFEGIDAWRTALSAPQLSQRLSTAFGLPVIVGSSQFTVSPAPQLLLGKVSFGQDLVLDEVAVGISYKQLGQAIQGRGLNWGEAVVSTRPLTLEQCHTLINMLPKSAQAFPKTLSTLRFPHLEVADEPWLAGPWDVTVSRRAGASMNTAVAVMRKDKGSLQLELSAAADPAAVAFQIEAHGWQLPFGPGFPLDELVGSGQVAAGRVNLEQFSVAGGYGAIKGRISGVHDAAWVFAGSAESDSVDLATLIRNIALPPNADDASAEIPTVIQGTAAFTGRFDGRGNTIDDAISAIRLEGPVHVRNPVLTGINLGYAATRPTVAGVTSGGSTRFTALDAVILTGPTQTVFREIRAHAGALAAYGEVNLRPDHSLTGHLHVDLGETRVLAPIRVAVRGTILKPEFGR